MNDTSLILLIIVTIIVLLIIIIIPIIIFKNTSDPLPTSNSDPPPTTTAFVKQCLSKSDCPTNFDCSVEQNICIPKGKCLGDTDCSQTSNVCVKGTCKACDSMNLCNADKPFCVNGKCMKSLHGTSCTSTSTCRGNNENLYCVNQVCTQTPGNFGDTCDAYSCANPLVCTRLPNGSNICLRESNLPTTRTALGSPV